MLSAIIENTVTKEDEYLYLKIGDNDITYYGNSIQNGNVKPIDKNIINKIYDLLKVNENCIYTEDYLDYKVYLDKENNIKHYLKDGVEDFIMLFENNGEDLNLYADYKNKNKTNSNNKIFKIGKFNIKISKPVMVIVPTLAIALSLGAGTIANSKVKYEVSNTSSYSSANIISSEEAMDLINSSQSLSQPLKEIISNETLFKDVFPYYKDTSMEYVIKTRLENLHIETYDETFMENLLGYYDELTPNIIHIREDIVGDEKNDIFMHEFIHLLQSCRTCYMYLKESLAVIVSDEYYDNKANVYSSSTENTKLLMDVIGPKMIWETVFGGNDTNLVNTLRNNLSASEADELISYLKQKPRNVDEKKITELIANLYKNINLKEITDDENIYSSSGMHLDRIYFNEDKMVSKTIENYDIEEAEKLNIISKTTEPLFQIPISDEKYNKMKNNSEYKIMDKSSVGNVDRDENLVNFNNYNRIIIEEYIVLKDDVMLMIDFDKRVCKVEYNTRPHPDIPGNFISDTATITDALSMGLVKVNYYELKRMNELTDEEKYSNSLVAPTEITSYVINIGKEVLINFDENNKPVNVKVISGESIKEMFPEQTIRSNDNNIIR